MSRKIIGVTVGTPISAAKIGQELKPEINKHVANALKGTARGEAVTIDDVSPVEHDMGVTVSSKNLIPFNYTTYSNNYGINFTVNTDGSITMDGTSKGSTYYIIETAKPIRVNAGTYTISSSASVPEGVNLWLRVVKNGESTGTVSNKFLTFTEPTDICCYISVKTGTTLNNLTIYPQIEKGAVATAYTPYVDVSTVKVKAQGKNLISSDLWNDKFEKQEDGSYKSITNITQSVNIKELNLPAQVYSVSYSLKSPVGKNYRLQFIYTDETTGDSGASVSSTNEYIAYRYKTNGKAIKSIRWGYSGQSNEVQFKDLQLEVGAVATEYEPYVEPVEYEVGEDGLVQVASIYPSTTLLTDTTGATIDVQYNRDINKAFAELQQAIISLGGNI